MRICSHTLCPTETPPTQPLTASEKAALRNRWRRTAEPARARSFLEHRGAVGGDKATGDGAGLLLQLPDLFLRQAADLDLPEPGGYFALTSKQ